MMDSKPPDAIQIEFSESLYPKQAIYGAAYVFIDRCYVLLEPAPEGQVRVRLKPKEGVELSREHAVGEFQNELLTQAWRQLILAENRELVEQVTTQALSGAAGPAGLDDLLDLDIGDETAFDDPLGIAMSWEEKYKNKGKTPPGEPRLDVPETGSEEANG